MGGRGRFAKTRTWNSVDVVIPIHDVNPARRTPWITYALIGANVVVFLITPVASTAGVEEISLAELCRQEAFYEHYGAIPRELVENEQLPVVRSGGVEVRPNGASCAAGPPTYGKLPYLSVVSSMFLHGGWLHLLGNMLFLWIFGNNVEERFGRLGYLLFYLFCGYVAAYGFALANPDSPQPLVGASGAVSGVLGAYLVLYPLARVWSLVPILFFIPLKLPAWLVLGMWFVLQWVYSAGYAVSEAGSVAYLAHILGFAVGVLIAIPVRLLKRPPPPAYGPYWPPPRRNWRRAY
jgi:membrane associated rhomboid family serine protease